MFFYTEIVFKMHNVTYIFQNPEKQSQVSLENFGRVGATLNTGDFFLLGPIKEGLSIKSHPTIATIADC